MRKIVTPLRWSRLALLGTMFCFFVALLAFLPSTAMAQKPVLTLKDTNRGTSVNLYATGDPGSDGFYLYKNERYGYYAWIPSQTTRVVTLPDNGDGLRLVSKDGTASFRASGGLVEFVDGGLKGAFDETFKAHQKTINNALFVQNELRAFWAISWKEKDTQHHLKFSVKGANWSDCEFSYPASMQGKYGQMTDDILRNFGFAEE
ncbi:hypothetical protein LJC36_00940 [Desulfovibrio sp. OttesenSCG-928-C14]|nr:hypothetical protein [Desulfovibrio sp. OttesenSCG-928-C14]